MRLTRPVDGARCPGGRVASLALAAPPSLVPHPIAQAQSDPPADPPAEDPPPESTTTTTTTYDDHDDHDDGPHG